MGGGGGVFVCVCVLGMGGCTYVGGHRCVHGCICACVCFDAELLFHSSLWELHLITFPSTFQCPGPTVSSLSWHFASLSTSETNEQTWQYDSHSWLPSGDFWLEWVPQMTFDRKGSQFEQRVASTKNAVCCVQVYCRGRSHGDWRCVMSSDSLSRGESASGTRKVKTLPSKSAPQMTMYVCLATVLWRFLQKHCVWCVLRSCSFLLTLVVLFPG